MLTVNWNNHRDYFYHQLKSNANKLMSYFWHQMSWMVNKMNPFRINAEFMILNNNLWFNFSWLHSNKINITKIWKFFCFFFLLSYNNFNSFHRSNWFIVHAYRICYCVILWTYLIYLLVIFTFSSSLLLYLIEKKMNSSA
jgi:hypothetical protein